MNQAKTSEQRPESRLAPTPGSAVTCEWCGKPATTKVRRIVTDKIWKACDDCVAARLLARGPYVLTKLPNDRIERPKASA